jgi:outer membrane protein OmpA-like peptidoglycan-associated protein
MFGQSKWDLTPDSKKALDDVVAILKNKPTLKLQIDGYASEEGDYYVNLGVSNARANAVKDYIASRGIDPKRLKMAYHGADKSQGEQTKNRRVELTLF